MKKTEEIQIKQKPKKPPTKTLVKKQLPIVKEEQVAVDLDPSTNKFIIETNICEPWAVCNVTMPKLLFTKSINSNEQKIKDKSSIAFDLHYVTKPNEPLSIVKAAKNGIEKLNLHHIDAEGQVQPTWTFLNARIAGIDFGTLSYEADGTEENPWNQIKVEVEYEKLLIDGFEV